MKPIHTESCTGVYGAPAGLEAEVGGLPFWREEEPIGNGGVVTSVYSVWCPTHAERAAVAAGSNILLGIHGREPISPVSVSVTNETKMEDDAS